MSAQSSKDREFVERLAAGAEGLGLALSTEAMERLCIHQQLVQRWSSTVNLTTVLDPAGMAERLFLDSAVVLPHLSESGRLHDVGSGAGFPGLVLKALRPGLSVTLSEARRKRCSFLKQASRRMGLERGLEIRWERVGWESAPGTKATTPLWDEVISRAAFPPLVWVEIGAPLVRPGGRLWVMAGQPCGDGDGALDWNRATLPDGFSLERVASYRLPFCRLERWLVAIRRKA